jgi:hypothetical protein
MTLLLEAWRTLTWRHWAWTLVIASAACASMPLQNIDVSSEWSLWQWLYYYLPWFVASGVVFMLALAVVEALASPAVPSGTGYFAAAVAATVITLGVNGLLSDHMARSKTRVIAGKAARNIPPHLHGAANLNNALLGSGFDMTVHGVLATMIYGGLRRSRHAEEALAQAELARAAARRRLVLSRLEAGRAVIDPEGVLARLAVVESVYLEDPGRGAALMDALIEELRTAIPRMREQDKAIDDEDHRPAG